MHTENDHTDDSNLKALRTEGGFTAPVGYFEQMRKHVLQQTTGLEADENFQVPVGYFDKSRMAILAKTTAKPVAIRLWYTRSFVKYAAAAVVLLTTTFSYVLYQQQSQSNLQSMTDDEIIMYLEAEGVRDIPVSEVSFVVNETPANSEEKYLMNNADEQSIIEEL
ncbi:MAG: hypothetical protein V4651_14215 [Bacteroidota bacterium]